MLKLMRLESCFFSLICWICYWRQMPSMLTEQVGNGFQSLVHSLNEGCACGTMSSSRVMNFHTRGILEVKAEIHSSCLTWFYDSSGMIWQGRIVFSFGWHGGKSWESRKWRGSNPPDIILFFNTTTLCTGCLPIRNSLRLGRALSHAILHIFPQLQGLLHSKNSPPCSGALTILTLQMFTRDTSLPNYWGNSILQ
jgi:hypothetical protein